MDSLENEISSIISGVTNVPLDRLGPETDLRRELNVDSLQGLQIVAAVEKRYGIRIPDEELDSYGTVRQIAGLVKEHS